MSIKPFIRPLLIVALLGSLSSNTWAEAKDNVAGLTAGGIAASAAAIDPMLVDVNTLLAQQPTGKLIDPTEQWLLAISRRPIMVGAEKLAAEADGLSRLPSHAVKAWQAGREILTY